MITSFNQYLNEQEGLGLDSYTPEELGEMILAEYQNDTPDPQKVKEMIDAGATVILYDEDYQTALHLAAMYGHTEIVKSLLSNGIEPDMFDQESRTPLHYAAWNGWSEIVKALLAAGASIDPEDSNYHTPLHLSTENKGHPEIAQMLIDSGAELGLQDFQGDTALHLAASWDNLEIVKVLLKAGAYKNARNDNDQTPWDVATDYLRIQCPELKP